MIAEAGNRNPRSIVRLLNRIIVTSRILSAEGIKGYEPMDVLIDLTLDDRKYDTFRSLLEFTVKPESKQTVSIGAFLADRLKKLIV